MIKKIYKNFSKLNIDDFDRFQRKTIISFHLDFFHNSYIDLKYLENNIIYYFFHFPIIRIIKKNNSLNLNFQFLNFIFKLCLF